MNAHGAWWLINPASRAALLPRQLPITWYRFAMDHEAKLQPLIHTGNAIMRKGENVLNFSKSRSIL